MTSTTYARVLSLLIAGLLGLSSAPVKADEPCPWNSDGDPFWRGFLTHLHLDGFNANSSHKTRITIGAIDFYGSTILAAAVQDLTSGTCTNHAIVDDHNNLFGGFLLFSSGMCFGPGADDITITSSSGVVACGVVYRRPNYNGYEFRLWGGGGNDKMFGGVGSEWLYGGIGDDYITDGTDVSTFGFDVGETGNDTLKGGWADVTRVIGGDGVDHAWDDGGTTDIIYGDAGDDACIFDSNNNFDTLDCGPGWDTVHSKTNTIGCEARNASCL